MTWSTFKISRCLCFSWLKSFRARVCSIVNGQIYYRLRWCIILYRGANALVCFLDAGFAVGEAVKQAFNSVDLICEPLQSC